MADMGSNYHNYRDISYGPPVFTSPHFNGDYHPDKVLGASVTGYPVQETPQPESRAFLPSRSARSSVSYSRHHIKRVPWLGFLALTGSGVTVILSLVVLVIVNHHVVWPNSGWSAFMRPASWLSALLSANGIFLHFALEEGLTVAWWYRASKPDATVRELHDVWLHGTSLGAALFAGRRITYISMATIFCALLPLNGFLLQGAISTVLSQETSDVYVNIPMVKTLPPGYSGTMISTTDIYDNNINAINSPFGGVWVQVLNLEASPNAGYAYAGVFRNTDTHEFDNWGCENSSICTTSAYGAGFNVSCEKALASYDLFPYDENGSNGTIFYVDIGWNRSYPNEIFMDMQWKDDPSCVGNYQRRYCTLKAAVVEYPVQIQMNISSTNVYPGPYISLPAKTTRMDDKVIEILPVLKEDGVSETVYGGISAYFGTYFNSEMNITTYPSTNGFWNGTYYPRGHFCTSLSPGIPENKPLTDNYFNSYCNLTFEYPLQEMKNQQIRDGPVLDVGVEDNILNRDRYVDLAEVVLEPLRHSMFLASVYQGFAWYGVTSYDLGKAITGNMSLIDDYVQTVQAVQVMPVSRYTVRFYLWGASLAVTYIIILFLIPLFWGFWTLRRKPTMSPVDVARAFKAPILSDYEHETKTLLKEHGRRSIHYDLVSSPDSFRRESGSTLGYFDMTSPRSQA